MVSLSTLRRYLRHLVKGKTRYWIHSPFLFTFINEVLRDEREYYAFTEIEQLVKKLKKDRSEVSITDFGAGPKNGAKSKRMVAEIAYRTTLPPKYGKLLFRLVNKFEVKNILELGTGLGISTLYLGLANPKAQLVSLEGSPALVEKAWEHLRQFELNDARILGGPFEETLGKAIDQLEQIDLAYIDGDHRKEAVLNNFKKIQAKLHPQSIVVIDDINWSDGMYEAWQEICNLPEVTLSIDLFRCGILFFRKEMAKEHIRLYY